MKLHQAIGCIDALLKYQSLSLDNRLVEDLAGVINDKNPIGRREVGYLRLPVERYTSCPQGARHMLSCFTVRLSGPATTNGGDCTLAVSR